MFYTFYDRDGSLTGLGSPGFVIANTTEILPPGQKGCLAKPAWNAYVCSNVCYRTLSVAYAEPGWAFVPANANNTRGSFR